jgi:hypothetical protein
MNVLPPPYEIQLKAAYSSLTLVDNKNSTMQQTRRPQKKRKKGNGEEMCEEKKKVRAEEKLGGLEAGAED